MGLQHQAARSQPPCALRDDVLIKPVTSPYTPAQVSQYLVRIGFPQDLSTFTPSLENMELLLKLHLLTFPFENTAMHYTPDHQVDVTSQGAFQRLVVDSQGSYCYGHGSLFLGIIRGLGYRAYAAGARVNENFKNLSVPQFGAVTHITILVQPFPMTSDRRHETYIVDAWFGSTTPIRPIPLSDAENNIVMGTTSNQRHRLTRRAFPLSSILESSVTPATRPDNVWCIEVQHSKGEDDKGTAPWIVMYSFTEDEIFPMDIELSSFAVANGPGLMMDILVCVRYQTFKDLDEEGRAIANAEFGEYPEDVAETFLWRYILHNNEVRRSIGGTSTVIKTLESDLDRVRALREIFHVNVLDDACAYIKGRSVAL